MTGYNKITCEYCGGDHFQRDCPDLREERSLAAMPGSAAACLTCIHWNRFEWQTPHGYGKCCVHQINTRASYECADYQKPKPPNDQAKPQPPTTQK